MGFLASTVEEELQCQEKSKTQREKHQEESGTVTCDSGAPLAVLHFQFCSLLQGFFLYFTLRSC